MKKYDMIVIGSGAGNIIVDACIEKGVKCALIEKDRFGGTCLNRGCIPTKVMVSVSDELRKMQYLYKIGIDINSYRLNFDKIKERVFEKINGSSEVKKYYESIENIEVFHDEATFKENKVIHLTKENIDITANKIVIAVGARTNVPHIDGIDKINYLTSEKIFSTDFPEKPYDSLIIVGGGAIGLEFAHAFSTFGSKVTIVQRNNRLAPKADEDISDKIFDVFDSYGIGMFMNSDSLSVREENGEKILKIKNKINGKEREISASEILFATGVKSNADKLKIENTDIKLDSRGYIRTNEFLETSVDGIYAIGDINGKYQLRHKANYEAEILAHNLYFKEDEDDVRWARYENVPSVIYTYPQIAFIGLTEKEAREKGYNIKIAKQYYSDVVKGYALGFLKNTLSDGFIKLIVDKDTDEFLGVQMIGYESSLLLQSYVELMNTGESTIKIVDEEIGSQKAKELRKKKITRFLKPNTLMTTNETMVPHPSLNEVSMWTKYFNFL